MGITFNGKVIDPARHIRFGGKEVQRVLANGRVVWQRRIDLYRGGTTQIAGAWTAQNGIWVNTGTIANTYGANMTTMQDQGTILYCDASAVANGGIRSGNWINFADYQGMTCTCMLDMYLRAWGYEDYKWDNGLPYAWAQIWASPDGALGTAPLAVAEFETSRGADSDGHVFVGTDKNTLYHYRRTLSFPCPARNGYLYFTMARSVPAYTQIRSAEIYIM